MLAANSQHCWWEKLGDLHGNWISTVLSQILKGRQKHGLGLIALDLPTLILKWSNGQKGKKGLSKGIYRSV